MFLYVITNLVNKKQYVGITVNPDRRWVRHCRRSGSTVISNAIKKYGKENFTFEIIFEGEEKLVKFLEQAFILRLETKTPTGYNLTDGGEGTLGWNPSEKTRKRIGLAQKGKHLSAQHIQIISEVQRKRFQDPAERKKISIRFKGVPKSVTTRKRMSEARRKQTQPTVEARKRMGEAQKKRFQTPESRREYSRKLSRRVLVKSIEYCSLREAALEQGINYNTLRSQFYHWDKTQTWPNTFRYLDA